MKLQPFADISNLGHARRRAGVVLPPAYTLRELADMLDVKLDTLRKVAWGDSTFPQPVQFPTGNGHSGLAFRYHKVDVLAWWKARNQ